jgi:hypothetical protein
MHGRRRRHDCWDVGVAGNLGGLRLLDEVDVVRDAAGPVCNDGNEDAVVEPRQLLG